MVQKVQGSQDRQRAKAPDSESEELSLNTGVHAAVPCLSLTFPICLMGVLIPLFLPRLQVRLEGEVEE